MHASREEIRQLIGMAGAIDCMVDFYQQMGAQLDASRPSFAAPLRRVHNLPAPADQKKFLGIMPAMKYAPGQGDTQYVGLKCLTIFSAAGPDGCSAHEGLFVLFDGSSGGLLCTLDAAELTALRTAASSAVAAKWLVPVLYPTCAGSESMTLGMLGTGLQARRHIEAIVFALQETSTPVGRILISGRQQERVERCVEDCQNVLAPHAVIEACSSVRSIVAQSHILCTTTSSDEPVLRWASDFRHSRRPSLILAIGACRPQSRELDAELVAAALRPIVVDTVEGVTNEAGELLAQDALAALDCHAADLAGLLQPLHEIGVSGYRGCPTAASLNRPLLYKAVGFGAQDLALAINLYAKLSR